MHDRVKELEALCALKLGSGEVTELTQLSGGASMESWRFCFAGRPLVLRRLPFLSTPNAALPNNSANKNIDNIADNDVGSISLATQAGLIDYLHQIGLKVPEIIAELPADSALGEGFIMSCIAGEALPNRLLHKPEFAEARKHLSGQCARELAHIHSLDPADLPIKLPVQSPKALLAEQERFYRQFGSSNAVFEWAFGWLSRHCPEPQEYRLVHADFRMGNFLVEEEGLMAVLDWELAHIGDPLRDISFLCIPSWRFGHYDLEAGGFATLEQWLADYEKASGGSVAREHFDWWMVFNILWWGVTCLRLGSTFRDGSVPTVERTIIGRRISEVELDLLLALEIQRGASNTVLQPPPEILSSDLPTDQEIQHAEIVSALIQWNKNDILKEASGHGVFAARVANNALGIVDRALQLGAPYAQRQRERLAELGYDDKGLADALLADFELCHKAAVWDHLRLTTLERLTIDQPNYAGRAVALARWCESDSTD
jgi:aminoglycoside phosphotransferase (APT) family kinase protein